MITIHIPTPLRKFTGQQTSFQTDRQTVADALQHLVQTWPELQKNLYDADGRVRSFIRIYVGDSEVEDPHESRELLGNGDEISIVPAIAGGTPQEPYKNGFVSRGRAQKKSAEIGGDADDTHRAGNTSALTPDELRHYSRHISIEGFGVKGQQKLKQARVLAVGTGGLGAPMLQYLAAAGVGTLGIVDFDRVDASNLHRQILFGSEDVGKPKVQVAARRLRELNPHITIEVHETRLTSENALDIIGAYDIVADGTDNFPTRYLINDSCVLLGKPNVHGSIFQFEGQISVFNHIDAEGRRGPNYRDLFPEPPPPGLVPDCSEAGVLGVLPGIIGSLQASEVIKLITGLGEPLAGKLLLFDALSMNVRTMKVHSSRSNPLTGEHPTITELIDYEWFCGLRGAGTTEQKQEPEVPEIDVHQLKELFDRGEDIQLIDVREPHEYEIAEIGGELIPLNTLSQHADRVRRDTRVIVHCRSGVRSAKAVKQLREQFGIDNAWNLKGGILAWSEEIDQSVATY